MKFKRTEFLYFLAFFILGFANTVITNSFLFGTSEYRHEITNYFYYMAAVLFALSFCMSKMWQTTMTKKAILCVVALIVTASIHLIGFGVSILAVIAAVGIDFKKIVKWCICTNLFYLAIVIIPAILEMIPNDTYEHYGKTAYCLGFAYYSNVPFIVIMICLMSYWLIRNRHLENMLLIIGLVINYILYKICTVRLVFYLYIMFLTLAILAKMFRWKRKNKWINFVATIMFPAASATTILASIKLYRYSILLKLDNILNGRLAMNYRGFTQYNLKIFGQKIETSKEWIDENYINHYFYIDSGYTYTLLCYGIIIFLILIFAYTMLSRYAVIRRDKKLLVCCMVICGFSIINNVLFNVNMNPFPILAMNIFLSDKNYIREKLKSSNLFIKRIRY